MVLLPNAVEARKNMDDDGYTCFFQVITASECVLLSHTHTHTHTINTAETYVHIHTLSNAQHTRTHTHTHTVVTRVAGTWTRRSRASA